MTCPVHRVAVGMELASLCLAAVFGFSATTPAAAATKAEAATVLKTQGPRTSGPVSVSLQNEINAAVDRGRTWLIVTQNVDGSWGTVTNSGERTETTALAALALLHDATVEQRAAALRGCRWLATNIPVPETPAVPVAWRALALSVALPLDASLSNAVPAAVAAAAAPGQAIVPMRRMLLQELGTNLPCAMSWSMAADDLPSMCISAMPPPTGNLIPAATNTLLRRIAEQWPKLMTSVSTNQPWARRSTWSLWIFARYINRAGGGTLADANGSVVDWRNSLALELVSSQNIAPANRGGYWTIPDHPASTIRRNPIRETAFALLTLDEL